MDEDTKTEPEWLTEIRAELRSAPGRMFGDSGDIDREDAEKLLRDRDHWKREAHGWRAEYDRASDKLSQCVTREYMETSVKAEVGSARNSERRRAAAVEADLRAQAENQRHDAAVAIECLKDQAANASADRSALEVAQHAVSILADRDTSPRLMRALFELAVAEHEERAQRRAREQVRWQPIGVASPTPDFLDRLTSDPEADS